MAEDGALAAGDDALEVLPVRGRRCSAGPFEMPPELWRELGWRDVETVTGREDREG